MVRGSMSLWAFMWSFSFGPLREVNPFPDLSNKTQRALCKHDAHTYSTYTSEQCKIYKNRQSRHSQKSNRLIHKQCSLNSNDGALSLGEHSPIGTLNIVAFWQTACQDWTVHREGTGASRKCSEAALSSGDEICSMSWKAAQLQGQASVWARRVPGLLLSSPTFNIVVDKSVTQN